MELRVPLKQEARLLLDARSVSALIDVPPEMVYRLIRDGRLPSILLEGTTRRLVPMSKLREWIQDAIKVQIDDPKEVKTNAPLDQSF